MRGVPQNVMKLCWAEIGSVYGSERDRSKKIRVLPFSTQTKAASANPNLQQNGSVCVKYASVQLNSHAENSRLPFSTAQHSAAHRHR